MNEPQTEKFEVANYFGDINEIATALAAAQATFEPVPKNKTGKVRGKNKQTGSEYSYDYRYADLADILKIILPKLSAQGIAVLQPLVRNDKMLTLTTLLVHKSGQFFQSHGVRISETGDPQDFGSQLSYARRYDFCAMVGVSPDEDTDSRLATDNKRAETTKKDPPKKPETPAAVDHHPAQGTNAPRPGEKTTGMGRSVPEQVVGAPATPVSGGSNPSPSPQTVIDIDVTPKTNVHGLEVTDDDVPQFGEPEPMPTAAEKKEVAARLRRYKLDPEKLKGVVLGLTKKASTDEISKPAWDVLLDKLDKAHVQTGGILAVYKVD